MKKFGTPKGEAPGMANGAEELPGVGVVELPLLVLDLDFDFDFDLLEDELPFFVPEPLFF